MILAASPCVLNFYMVEASPVEESYKMRHCFLCRQVNIFFKRGSANLFGIKVMIYCKIFLKKHIRVQEVTS